MTISKPKVLLFDIGGVCVVSPFSAILAYEQRNNIPIGWINTAISASGKSGAWANLECGKIPLDEAFFTSFSSDLCNEKAWRKFHTSLVKPHRAQGTSTVVVEEEEAIPAPPNIDAEPLFWEMMTVSRKPDAYMWPALQTLRTFASENNLILAALSNTVVFPAAHPFNCATSPDGVFYAALRSAFDLFLSSAHLGVRKPDPEIYLYAIAELDILAKEKGMEGVKAEDILFLDDIGANLRTGREVGMRTIKVELGETDRTVEELERMTGLRLRGAVTAKL